MTTLATALKEEIRRLARKEIKATTQSLAKAVAQYRREIAKLKRQVRDQERNIASLRSHVRTDAPQLAVDNTKRFSARSVKAQRAKTGLSAADYALLVGVSALTVYNWENGKSRPRKEQFAALASLRGLWETRGRPKTGRGEQTCGVIMGGKAPPTQSQESQSVSPTS